MANWNLLSEALSVLEGRCDNKVTGTAYLCCVCLRTLVPVLHYIHQIRYTSDVCISVCHLPLGNKFFVLRLQVIFMLPCLVSSCAFCRGQLRDTRQILTTFKWYSWKSSIILPRYCTPDKVYIFIIFKKNCVWRHIPHRAIRLSIPFSSKCLIDNFWRQIPWIVGRVAQSV
jgi:hypothetical protein